MFADKGKNRLFKRFAALALGLIIGLAAFGADVFAAEGSITYSYITDNVVFSLYRVGDIKGSSYELSGRYALYSVNLSDTSGAAVLGAYIERDGLEADDMQVTDSSGRVVFSGLSDGVYLILGKTVIKNNIKYTALPVLTCIVGGEAREVNGKFETENVGSNPGSSTGEDKPDNPSTSTGEDKPDNPSTSTGDDKPTDPGTSTGKDGPGTSTSGGGGSASPVNPKEISVVKEWKGDKAKTEITVQLLRNGEVYKETVLNADNNWRYTWKNVSRTDVFTVVEKEVPKGYAVSVDKDGTAFVITNTPEEDVPAAPDLPTNPENPDYPADSDNPKAVDSPPEGTTLGGSGTAGDKESSTSVEGSAGTDEAADVDTDNPNTADSDSSSSPDEGQGQGGSEAREALPQTGQLWWPVAILACLGVFCLIIGMGRRREGR